MKHEFSNYYRLWQNGMAHRIPKEALPCPYVGQRGKFHIDSHSYLFCVEKVTPCYSHGKLDQIDCIGDLYENIGQLHLDWTRRPSYNISTLFYSYNIELDFSLQRIIDQMAIFCQQDPKLVDYATFMLDHVYKHRGKTPESIDGLLIDMVETLPEPMLTDNLRAAKEKKLEEKRRQVQGHQHNPGWTARLSDEQVRSIRSSDGWSRLAVYDSSLLALGSDE
jgi:hypothetical protein